MACGTRFTTSKDRGGQKRIDNMGRLDSIIRTTAAALREKGCERQATLLESRSRIEYLVSLHNNPASFIEAVGEDLYHDIQNRVLLEALLNRPFSTFLEYVSTGPEPQPLDHAPLEIVRTKVLDAGDIITAKKNARRNASAAERDTTIPSRDGDKHK